MILKRMAITNNDVCVKLLIILEGNASEELRDSTQGYKWPPP